MFFALVLGALLTVALVPPSPLGRDVSLGTSPDVAIGVGHGSSSSIGRGGALGAKPPPGVDRGGALGAKPPPGVAAFGWPLDQHQVVRRFDPPPERWLPGHRGVDLAGSPSAVVHAVGAGKVVFAGQVAGRGVISVVHPGGLRTTYEPVIPSVAVGETVSSGGDLGRLSRGHPGCPAAACLHWGLRRGALYLDPLALLGLGRVRLLPLNAGPSP